jgi:hypothetical protein
VTEPTTEAATTAIVPTARDANVPSPDRNMPAIAMITVIPETTTARPEVAAATAMASYVSRPLSRSSRSRRM